MGKPDRHRSLPNNHGADPRSRQWALARWGHADGAITHLNPMQRIFIKSRAFT